MDINPSPGIQVLYCYAREDVELRSAIDKHLTTLKRSHLVSTWHDGEISAGTPWKAAIAAHLQAAHIILLLISPDFIASDYCYEKELTLALARHQAGHARVIPILLRPVDFEGEPFADLQMLPTGAKPIIGPDWHSQDSALVDVAKGIRQAVKEVAVQRQNELCNIKFSVASNTDTKATQTEIFQTEGEEHGHTFEQASQIMTAQKPSSLLSIREKDGKMEEKEEMPLEPEKYFNTAVSRHHSKIPLPFIENDSLIKLLIVSMAVLLGIVLWIEFSLINNIFVKILAFIFTLLFLAISIGMRATAFGNERKIATSNVAFSVAISIPLFLFVVVSLFDSLLSAPLFLPTIIFLILLVGGTTFLLYHRR